MRKRGKLILKCDKEKMISIHMHFSLLIVFNRTWCHVCKSRQWKKADSCSPKITYKYPNAICSVYFSDKIHQEYFTIAVLSLRNVAQNTCHRWATCNSILLYEAWVPKVRFTVGWGTKEAENVFLTHGWENEFECAGGLQVTWHFRV